MKVDKSMMEKLYQNRVFAIIQWVLKLVSSITNT